jgi:sugar phosphate isomerase/epimerase
MRILRLLCYFMLLLPVGQLAAQAPVEIGVQLYSFREQFKTDVHGTMGKVRDMGFRYVETAGFYGLEVPAFKKLLDSYGLRAVSTGADFAALQDSAQLLSTIQTAKALGAEYVVCFWIPHNGNDFTLADMQKAVTVFNRAGKIIADNGMQLLYHPHGYEFRPHAGGFLLDYLIQNTKPRNLGLEMDIYWIKCPGQDPVNWLRKYPKRWKTMHLKDQQKDTPGDQNGHSDVEWNVTIGTGNQDMPAVMRQARKNKIKYYFIEDESSRSLDQAPKSLAYLRGL